MESTPKPFNINDYIQIGLRRKWYIVIPLVCSVIISMAVYRYLPKVYKTTTVILVQPQSVPESYIRATVTATVTDRLNTIRQDILSRTRLEKIIDEFNVYPNLRKNIPMEEIVGKMVSAIQINIIQGVQAQTRHRGDQTQNAFAISYEGEEPRTIMLVTNKLASLFIEENLKFREIQAESTSQFLTKELQGIEEQLMKKEEEVRRFRQKHMGQLPQQLDANLRIRESIQLQIKTTSEGIRGAEDRSIVLQGQIDNLKRSEPSLTPPVSQGGTPQSTEQIARERIPEDPVVTQWNLLIRELESTQSKYTENHPDVLNLKRKIAILEPKAKEILKKQEEMDRAQPREIRTHRGTMLPAQSPAILAHDQANERLIAQYTGQYNSALLEAKRLKEEEKKLKEQIHLYDVRIEETPKREQELLLITRDYDLLKTNYNSLMEKKNQSQMAENLERKQQGEQFKVLDPARVPEQPIRPNRDKILLMGAFFGLVAGLGLAWFRETLDQSFHSEADLEAHLGLPILAIIPNLKEEKLKEA